MDQSDGHGQPVPNRPFVDRRQKKPDVWSRVFRYLAVLVYPLLLIYFFFFLELADSFEQSNVAKQIGKTAAEVPQSLGLEAFLLPTLIAGAVIGATGLILSFKRARRQSDYNYRTQLFLVILSVVGLAVFYLIW